MSDKAECQITEGWIIGTLLYLPFVITGVKAFVRLRNVSALSDCSGAQVV
jgi:hypothetical protein